jgi:acetyl-CoA acyltransferase
MSLRTIPPWVGALLIRVAQGADQVAGTDQISREVQDRFALGSHQKAIAAIDAGRFDRELVSVTVGGRKGDTVIAADEGPRRDTSLAQLAALKPAFQTGGSVTAGNASSLNDGAAAVLLVSRTYAQAHGKDS